MPNPIQLVKDKSLTHTGGTKRRIFLRHASCASPDGRSPMFKLLMENMKLGMLGVIKRGGSIVYYFKHKGDEQFEQKIPIIR